MEKLDRLGTCLALTAPAGFVALGCHTSVAGPPFTLRGSWTTPRPSWLPPLASPSSAGRGRRRAGLIAAARDVRASRQRVA